MQTCIKNTPKNSFYIFNQQKNLLRFNPLNAELNPIYHLLALIGVHHILHISRVWVKHMLHDVLFLFMILTNLVLRFKYQPSHFKFSSSHVAGVGAPYGHECI